MATDVKTGNIINDDKSFESIRADRAQELANPGDEGPKVPKDLASAMRRNAVPLPGTERRNEPAPKKSLSDEVLGREEEEEEDK